MRAHEALQYSTKELTKKTLPDFERFFEKHPAPGAFSCWCIYHHRTRSLLLNHRERSGITRAARNRLQRRKLVERESSHGILVYLNGDPVGWCQYGPQEELPRIDNNRSYRRLAPQNVKGMWRITCFVVDRKHRRRGVASAALRAALEGIWKKGGGLVEAYPITQWGAYREYHGTVSMFQKEGFRVVAPYGKSNVVMRKII